MEAEIREVKESDLEDIRELNRKSWEKAYRGIIPEEKLEENTGDYPHERLQGKMRDDKLLFLVAEVDGKVVGTINFCWSEENTHDFVNIEQKEAQLRAVYLHPKYWKKGIGTELVKAGVEKIPEKIEKLKVESLAENEIGRGFYSKMGFETVEQGQVELFGDNYPTVIQEKEL